jgi:hypothetical protein
MLASVGTTSPDCSPVASAILLDTTCAPRTPVSAVRVGSVLVQALLGHRVWLKETKESTMRWCQGRVVEACSREKKEKGDQGLTARSPGRAQAHRRPLMLHRA